MFHHRLPRYYCFHMGCATSIPIVLFSRLLTRVLLMYSSRYICLVVSVVASHCCVFALRLDPFVFRLLCSSHVMHVCLMEGLLAFILLIKAVLSLHPACGSDLLYVSVDDRGYHREPGSITVSGGVPRTLH